MARITDAGMRSPARGVGEVVGRAGRAALPDIGAEATSTIGRPMARHADSVLASNRRARHEYAILDVLEAGIVLHGSEVKSVRAGNVQIAEAWAHVMHGEMWLEGMHVGAYEHAHGVGAHEPVQPRKLLMHKAEIRRLAERVATERLALVPLALRLRAGRVKVDLALAKGRQKADRRQAIREKETRLEMRRAARTRGRERE
jgi:SsrA-binding protein